MTRLDRTYEELKLHQLRNLLFAILGLDRTYEELKLKRDRYAFLCHFVWIVPMRN